MTPLHILHMASGDGWGGAERSLALLIRGLRDEPSVSPRILLFNEGRLARELRALGVPVDVIPESGRSLPRLVGQVRAFLKEQPFTAVHVHRYKELVVAVLALLPRRRPVVATIHGLEPRAQLSWWRAAVLWGAIGLGRLYGTRFAAVSLELRDRLRARLGQTAVVEIPNPMQPPEPAPGAPDLRTQLGWEPRRPLVGFVGRLEPVKGPDVFLDVASRDRGGAGYVLLGGGSLEGALRARIDREGLGDRVALLGHVDRVHGLLAQLDVLALTSRHEGLPMVLLEAAAAGVPVVAFDVGGVAEILDGGPGGRVVPAGDGAAFRRALDETLAGRAEARAGVARWATPARTRFSLPAVVAAYLVLYGDAVGGRRSTDRPAVS